MILNTVFYIFISICLALAISYYFYFYKNSNFKNKFYKQLFLLRAFSIFLLIFFIINPKFSSKSYSIQKPNLLLAIDQSKSIEFLNQTKAVKSFINNLKSDKKLNSKFNLRYFGFGNNLYKLDTLVFNKFQTNISKPLRQLNNLYDKNSAIILISDGNQTNGKDYQFYKSKLPIYALSVGDTSKFEDLKITQVNHNDLTFKGNKFPIEVFFQYQGNNQINTKFLVYENGKIIYSHLVKLSDKINVSNLKFELISKQSGLHQYTAVLNPIKGEKNKINNSAYFSIKTLSKKSNILLISNIKHPDIGALKRSIESNNQRKLKVIIGNSSKANLNNYKLVIIYQPNSNQSVLYKKLQKSNISYITITGTQTDWDFLNKAQKIYHKEVGNLNQEDFPYFNKAYKPFSTNLIDFKNFPPLLSKIGTINFSIDPEVLLFSSVNNINTKQVLAATFKYNRKRGGVIFGENIWKLRMAWFKNNKDFIGFDNFISSIIQYLSNNKLNNKIKVSYKPVIYANNPIEFDAKLYNETGEFDNRGKLEIEIKKESSNTNKIFPLILNFPIEKQFYNANFIALKTLVSNNKGGVILLENYRILVKKLINDNQYKSIQKQTIKITNLISLKWLFLLFIISASTEWFMRKYRGLI